MVQPAEDKTRYFYVDEAGDPNFYGKGKKVIVGQEGCSLTLILGYVVVEDPHPLRDALEKLRSEIAEDEYLQQVPSVEKTLRAFHAKDDCPEVRYLVYRLVKRFDFNVQARVARKIEPLFRKNYHGKRDLFYDDLVSRLFRDSLHTATRNVICFARRGNRSRQRQLRDAIDHAIASFRQRWNADVDVEIDVQTAFPSQEPMLQVIDYANWALQRAFERSQMRYFEFLRDKYQLVVDEFDTEKYGKRESNLYDRKRNPFDIEKVSPLG